MARAHFFDEGPSESRAVVLLHAFPLHSGMWDGVRRALSAEGRVVGLDFRGLGKTEPGDTAFLLEHWVDDLLELLDERRIEHALLVGLSMGGYLALRMTERVPSRVAGLFLADTQAAADTNATKWKRAAGIRQLEHEGVGAYLENFLKGALSRRTFAERPDIVDLCRALGHQQTVRGLCAGLVALATRSDCSEGLSRIAVPTRLVVGEDDHITPPQIMQAMAHQIRGADLHVLEGAGHLSSLEAPEAFQRLLLEHVRAVWAARG